MQAERMVEEQGMVEVQCMVTRAMENDLEELLRLIGPLKTPVEVREIEIARIGPDGTVSPKCPDFIVDSTDIVAEVVRWLNSPDTYRFRLGNAVET